MNDGTYLTTLSVLMVAATTASAFVLWSDSSGLLTGTILITAAVIAVGLLWALWLRTQSTSHAAHLSAARVHIAAHIVPGLLILGWLAGLRSPWLSLATVVLLTLFFTTGKSTWHDLAQLYPGTKLYRLFYFGNTAFRNSFPLLYVGTLLWPNFVSFTAIETIALLYFCIHFLLLGPTALKLESDLNLSLERETGVEQ